MTIFIRFRFISYKLKNKTFRKFQEFKILPKKKIKKEITYFKIDRGDKYLIQKFINYLIFYRINQ